MQWLWWYDLYNIFYIAICVIFVKSLFILSLFESTKYRNIKTKTFQTSFLKSSSNNIYLEHHSLTNWFSKCYRKVAFSSCSRPIKSADRRWINYYGGIDSFLLFAESWCCAIVILKWLSSFVLDYKLEFSLQIKEKLPYNLYLVVW